MFVSFSRRFLRDATNPCAAPVSVLVTRAIMLIGMLHATPWPSSPPLGLQGRERMVARSQGQNPRGRLGTATSPFFLDHFSRISQRTPLSSPSHSPWDVHFQEAILRETPNLACYPMPAYVFRSQQTSSSPSASQSPRGPRGPRPPPPLPGVARCHLRPRVGPRSPRPWRMTRKVHTRLLVI